MGLLADNMSLAEDLSHYSRLCYDRHLVGAAGGNVSARLPGEQGFLVTASGVALRDVSPANLMVVDVDNHVLENPANGKPSKEAGFHLVIYRDWPETGAVIHVHPAHATVYSALGQLIPLVTISATLKLKQGPLVPEAPPGSVELSNNVAQALSASPSNASILLLERHGIIGFDKNLCAAFDDVELAEDTAKIALLTANARERASSAVPHPTIVDLSVVLGERTHYFPTDPPFKKLWHAVYKDVGANLSKLEMGAHSGTHVDVPLHFLDGGADLLHVPLTRFYGPAIAVDTPKGPGELITAADCAGLEVRPGDIVLFRTGWEERSCTPRFFEGNWPAFSADAVDALVRMGAGAIGGDIASADGPTGLASGCPAHKRAMAAGLPIFEALVNLSSVVGRRFTFAGFPLKIEGGEASPIRAVAILD